MTFDKELAIRRYTELMRCIHVGAYDVRDHEGNYGADGIEESIDNLDLLAASHGLAFHWHEDTGTYTLEPMLEEEIAAYKAAIESEVQPA